MDAPEKMIPEKEEKKGKTEQKLAFGMHYHETNDLLINISVETNGETVKLGEYHKVVAELFAKKLNEIASSGGASQERMEALLGSMNAANDALKLLHFFDVTIK